MQKERYKSGLWRLCEGIVLCGFISSNTEYKTSLSTHVPTQEETYDPS